MSLNSVEKKSSKELEANGHYTVHVEEKQVDEGAHFSLGRAIDPEEALRLRKKIDRHILPMMCGMYWKGCCSSHQEV